MLVRLRICTTPSLSVLQSSICIDMLSHPHYPLLCTTTLASLVKGEVLSPEKIRATTGGIVAPPTLPKPHYPSRFPYCNRLYALICFHIHTILFAFRRGVGLPLPFHRILSPSQPLQKNTNHLPFLPFPLHRPSLFLQPSQKHINRLAPHHHTCLPCQR